MGYRDFEYTLKKGSDGGVHVWVRKTLFDEFSPIFSKADGGYGEKDKCDKDGFMALAAVFDLEEFTPFCEQDSSRELVPPFITAFLEWLFDELRSTFPKASESSGLIPLWARFQVWEKFTGDGVMLLWDLSDIDGKYLGEPEAGNIIARLYYVCQEYQTKFTVENTGETYTKRPKKLRCGIAKGSVTSVIDGTDFVGACLNRASRLQKEGFAFSPEGIDINKCFDRAWKNFFEAKDVDAKGIGKMRAYVPKAGVSAPRLQNIIHTTLLTT